jgi:metal-responsive CopG/Arc/MetJ family transcriptional regulator
MKRAITDRTIAELQRQMARRLKKEKTSVSLSGELIEAIDTLAGKTGRSAMIERALRTYLKRIIRRHRNEKDLAVINSHADAINRESGYLLDIQAWPE